MIQDGIEYRPYREGDEEAVNDGFNQVFRTRRSLLEWGWKFPPHDGGRLIMTAWRDDELLAHYAGVPVRFQVDGRVWPAAQIVDVYSKRTARSAFSRRGVWVRTVERFFETFGESGRCALLYGFPSPRPLRLGVLQLGYDNIPPQPITFLERQVGRSRLRPRRLLYRAELARDWEPRLDRLWERVRSTYRVAAVRDADRALRRLAGHPSVHYHRFLVFPRLSAQPVAFVAFRCDDGACRWVDLLWDHEHPGALGLVALLSERLAHEHRATVEHMWLNGDPDGVTVLASHGFMQRPEPNRLVMVARSFPPAFGLNALHGRVYLTMADADLV